MSAPYTIPAHALPPAFRGADAPAIVITQPKPGRWKVALGDAYCRDLCWDEMLGQVVGLTHWAISGPLYPMLTAEGHRQRDEALQSRAAASRDVHAREDAQRRQRERQDLVDALRQWKHAEAADDAAEFANAQRARDLALARVAEEDAAIPAPPVDPFPI